MLQVPARYVIPSTLSVGGVDFKPGPNTLAKPLPVPGCPGWYRSANPVYKPDGALHFVVVVSWHESTFPAVATLDVFNPSLTTSLAVVANSETAFLPPCAAFAWTDPKLYTVFAPYVSHQPHDGEFAKKLNEGTVDPSKLTWVNGSPRVRFAWEWDVWTRLHGLSKIAVEFADAFARSQFLRGYNLVTADGLNYSLKPNASKLSKDVFNGREANELGWNSYDSQHFEVEQLVAAFERLRWPRFLEQAVALVFHAIVNEYRWEKRANQNYGEVSRDAAFALRAPAQVMRALRIAGPALDPLRNALADHAAWHAHNVAKILPIWSPAGHGAGHTLPGKYRTTFMEATLLDAAAQLAHEFAALGRDADVKACRSIATAQREWLATKCFDYDAGKVWYDVDDLGNVAGGSIPGTGVWPLPALVRSEHEFETTEPAPACSKLKQLILGSLVSSKKTIEDEIGANNLAFLSLPEMLDR